MTQLLSHDGLQSTQVDTSTVSVIIGSTPPDGDIEFQGNIVADSEVRFVETADDQTEYVGLKAAPMVPANITFCLPSTDGAANTPMITDGSGVLSFGASSVGNNVTSSSTWGFDNRVLRTDGTGRAVERTGISVDDFDVMSGGNGLNFSGTSQMKLESSNATPDAIKLNATSPFGGVDVNANDIKLNATGSLETSILLNSSGGGIDLEAGSGHTLELDGGQVKIKNKDNTAKAIEMITNQGTSETIELINTQGTADDAILLESLAGGVNIVSHKSANAIVISAANATGTLKLESGSSANVDINGVLFNNGGVSNIDSLFTSGATGQLFLQTSFNAASAVSLNATIGGISLLSGGKCEIQSNDTTTDSVDINTPFGGILLNAALVGSTEAIKLQTTAATSGITITSGASSDVNVNGVLIDTSSNIEAFNLTLDNILALEDTGAGTNVVKFVAPSPIPTTYTIKYPDNVGATGNVLVSDVAGTVASLSWTASLAYPPAYIHGFEQQWVNVTTIKMGLNGVRSAARNSDDTFNFVQDNDVNISITTSGPNGLSTSHTESANQSYEIYLIGDSTGVESQAFLIVEEGQPIATVDEFFMGGAFDKSRLVGWFRNDSGLDILKHFTQGYGADRSYYYDVDKADTIVLSAGTATTFTNVDCSSFLALTSNVVILRAAVGDPDGPWDANSQLVLRPDGSAVTSASALYTVSPGVTMSAGDFHDAQIEVPTSTRFIEYLISSATDNAFLYVVGFKYSVH